MSNTTFTLLSSWVTWLVEFLAWLRSTVYIEVARTTENCWVRGVLLDSLQIIFISTTKLKKQVPNTALGPRLSRIASQLIQRSPEDVEITSLFRKGGVSRRKREEVIALFVAEIFKAFFEPRRLNVQFIQVAIACAMAAHVHDLFFF
jgi:hypothetical protein